MNIRMESNGTLGGYRVKNTFTTYGLTVALARLFTGGPAIDTLSIRSGSTVLATELDEGYPVDQGVVRYQATFNAPATPLSVTSINVHDGTGEIWSTQIERFVVDTSADPVESPVLLQGNNRYTFAWDLRGSIDILLPDEAPALGSGISALNLDSSSSDLAKQIAGLQSRPFSNPDVQLWGADPVGGFPPMESIFPENVILRDLISSVSATVDGDQVTFGFLMPAIADSGLFGNRYAVLLVDTTLALGVADIGPVGPREADTEESTAVLTMVS